MSSWQFGFDLVATFLLASFLLFQYGNWYRHHVVVTLSVLVAWYFSFVIVFILPLDISSTFYRQCLGNPIAPLSNDTHSTVAPEHGGLTIDANNQTNNTIVPNCPQPSAYVDSVVLENLWRVVYWSSQVLTWLVLPLMQSYTQAGEFTVKGKLKSALLDNAIYYGSYLFICGILLAYIAVKPDLQLDNWQKIKGVAAAASNTWGLFLLVFMLGYGLVALPRSIWFSSSIRHSLNNSYFKLSKLSQERNNAEEELDDVLETLQLCMKKINERSPLFKYVDTIQIQVPPEFRERMQRRRIHDSGGVVIDEKLLVKLHRKMKMAVHTYHRTEQQWADHVEHTLFLEEVDKNMKSRERRYQFLSDVGSFNKKPSRWNSIKQIVCTPVLEWYWRCLIQSWFLKAVALVGGILSIMVIWSEATFFVRSPALSLFAVFLNLGRDASDYWTIETISTLTIAYLAVCAFYTVFKVRVFNFYYLARAHQTNEYSLIFAGMLLCRLTPPLCLNYLGLIHMDSHVIEKRILETKYTQVMGHMDVLSLVSDGFNIYFPMGILVVGLCTWFKVGARLLSLIGFQQFLTDDEITTDLVSEGVQLVQREKRRRQRNTETNERRRNIQDRLNRSLQAANDANRTAEDMENLEYDRTSILGSNLSRSTRIYGSPDTNNASDNFGGSTGSGGRIYQPPRDLFDDV